MPAQEQAKSSDGGGGKKRGRGEEQPGGGDVAGQATATQQASPTPEAGPVKRRPGRPKSSEPGTPQERWREKQKRERAVNQEYDESEKAKDRQRKNDPASKARAKLNRKPAELTSVQTIIKVARGLVHLDQFNKPFFTPELLAKEPSRMSLAKIRQDLDAFIAWLAQEQRGRPPVDHQIDDAKLHEQPLGQDGKVPYRTSAAYRKAEEKAICVAADYERRLREALGLHDIARTCSGNIVRGLFRRCLCEEDVDRDALWKKMVARLQDRHFEDEEETAGAGPGPSTVAGRAARQA